MKSADRKTLLVLGGSYYQCEAIRTAQGLGYRVVVVDNRPDNLGHDLAERSYVADTTDQETVLGLARRERINGVIAFATDVAVLTQAYVAENLGLPGPSVAAARIATDKAAFQELAAEVGISTLPSWILEPGDGPNPDAFFNGPAVLRPDRSSGSKGCFIVGSVEDCLRRLPEARSFAGGGRLVLQPLVDGHQGTIEGVFDKGEFPLFFFSDRKTAEAPHVATMGHSIPSSLCNPSRERALGQIRRLWSALGVESTVFDCDFVATEEEVFILELTPRLGGNSICRMIQAASGIDLLTYAIRTACDDAVTVPVAAELSPTALSLLGVAEAGVLDYDEAALEALEDEPWVVSLVLDLPRGACVEPFRHGRNRVGEAMVQAQSEGELKSRLAEVRCRLGLRAGHRTSPIKS